MNFFIACALASGFVMVRALDSGATPLYVTMLVMTVAFIVAADVASNKREREIAAAMRRHPAGGRGNR